MKNQEAVDNEFANNVFNNMMDLYFNPEIKKRKQENLIPDNFTLIAAQAIIYPDGRQPAIKFNNEVSAEVRLKKEVNKDVEGFSPVVSEIEFIKLRDEEFLNCGHVTIIMFSDGFHISFDFQYNKQISVEHLKVAQQFIQTSKYALEEELIHAFIDNSFSAVELLAKTHLLLEANPSIQGKTTHRNIKSVFNLRFKNSQSPFEIDRRKILNELASARTNARYLEGKITYNQNELKTIYQTIEHMYVELCNRASYNAG